ncbi:hypothetical protein GCM10011594_32610 [Nakamurella endophytica]|uniref:DinB family protein n=2 Tax=Nakamurella endophytica TaxID=1748367 RepID=A0A917T5L8_9ACTN|nr:hypothetical protein GCM10011594_32610 [Nakamurella endophytica]
MESTRRSLSEAVDLLSDAVQKCPDDLWCASMWRVEAHEIVGPVNDGGGGVITDPTEKDIRIQRWAQPWSVAWHALEVLDYDLNGELRTWTPPPPFAGNPHWKTFASLRVGWSKAEIASYIDECRRRVQSTFDAMTDVKAATLLPAAHRYAGQPYAWLVTSLIGHTTAHAMQIRQFITTTARSKLSH